MVFRLGMTAGSKDVFYYGFAGYQPVNPNTNVDMTQGRQSIKGASVAKHE